MTTANFHAARAKRESQRVHRVVRNAEWRDLDIAHAELPPGLDEFHAIEALGVAFVQNAQRFGVRLGGDVYRRGAPLAQQRRQAANMIGMFVGDDDAVEPVDLLFEGRQPPKRLLLAQAGVHQEARLTMSPAACSCPSCPTRECLREG